MTQNMWKSGKRPVKKNLKLELNQWPISYSLYASKYEQFTSNYDSRVVNYDGRGFIRLATGVYSMKLNRFVNYRFLIKVKF